MFRNQISRAKKNHTNGLKLLLNMVIKMIVRHGRGGSEQVSYSRLSLLVLSFVRCAGPMADDVFACVVVAREHRFYIRTIRENDALEDVPAEDFDFVYELKKKDKTSISALKSLIREDGAGSKDDHPHFQNPTSAKNVLAEIQ